MNRAAIRFGAPVLGLALFAPGTAHAQLARGEMGPQSQAAVRISVSVAPRFELKRAAMAANSINFEGANAGQSLAVTSSAPGLRYSVQPVGKTTCPADSAAERTQQDPARSCGSPAQSSEPKRSARLLLMVVPD
jgi:hypothetical protein